MENPSIAVNMLTRFPSPILEADIRLLLRNSPHKALDEPNALNVLLGDSLHREIYSQLKVCNPKIGLNLN